MWNGVIEQREVSGCEAESEGLLFEWGWLAEKQSVFRGDVYNIHNFYGDLHWNDEFLYCTNGAHFERIKRRRSLRFGLRNSENLETGVHFYFLNVSSYVTDIKAT